VIRVVKLTRKDTGQSYSVRLAALEGLGLALEQLPDDVEVDLVVSSMTEEAFGEIPPAPRPWG